MLTIDPMHNLYLGSGKHMLHLWLDHDLLSTSHFQPIQKCVDSPVVPSDVGRIPQKIERRFFRIYNWSVQELDHFFSISSLYGVWQDSILSAGNVLF